MANESRQAKLKLLTSCTTEFEAEHLKLLLEAEGISVALDGLHASNNFAFNASMGAVQVRVPQDQLARARQVLEDFDSSQQTAWTCAQCHEENEGSFDFCWKCGSPRSDWRPEPPESQPVPVYDPDSFKRPEAAISDGDSTNPYSPPLSSLTTPPNNPDADQSDALEEVEDTIRRAFRASIFGLLFFPPLLHTYSLLLLLGATGYHGQLSKRALIQWRIGMFINVAAILIGGWIWLTLVKN